MQPGSQSSELMKERSVSRTEGGRLGPDWIYSRQRWDTWESAALTELHCVCVPGLEGSPHG